MHRPLILACLSLSAALAQALPRDYTIVCSESTAADPQWKPVIAALEAKYTETGRVTYPDGDVRAAGEALKTIHPRYTCFVAPHAEVTAGFVTAVHQLTRALDDDPYTDTLWGILTGYDAANALQIAQTKEPLTVGRVASGTEVALDQCQEGVWYCELVKGKVVRKQRGGKPVESSGPADSTAALVASLNDYKPGLFVTSGHATERDWQIGFRYRNGSFRSAGGVLYGLDTAGEKHPVDSPNPKVYLPIGNCLMGHIDSGEAMALAWMKSAGVRQMMGYTVPTWYGYAGWGVLDYFVEQPGSHTLTEAFFANQHALIHRLEANFPGLARQSLDAPNDATKLRGEIKLSPAAKAAGLSLQDGIGLLFDRDAVAFYGDPAWHATMAKGDRHYQTGFASSGGSADERQTYTVTITPKRGADSFKPVNTNGSQRGWRPIVVQFGNSGRLRDIEILEGAELNPVVADDFILVPNPRECDPAKEYKVVFRATPIAG